MRKLIISKPIVTNSAAGYYVGTWCFSFCLEPYDRETGYMTEEEANKVIKMMYEPNEITTREEFLAMIKPLAEADNAAYQAGRTKELEIRCGQCNTLYHMHVNPDQYLKYKNKEIKLSEFTYLDTDEREMLQSQICPECWSQMFPEEE